MFTGIIEALATVEEITQIDGNMRVQFSSQLSSGLKPGQSLSHNGVCLTIERVELDRHQVSLVPETLKKTSLGSLKPGDLINLERSLRVGQGIEGHFVQGHIDNTGSIVEIKKAKNADENETEVTVAYPSIYKDLVVPQGSIALHGISLTLAKIGQSEDTSQSLFSVCIIPHSYENTNISKWQKGSLLNIEFDILGKYVRNILRPTLR